MPGYDNFLLPPDTTVVLPSGMGSDPQFPVVLRYPTMRYFLINSSLPARLVTSISKGSSLDDIEKMSRDEVTQSLKDEPLTADRIDDTEHTGNLIICDVFVKPRFALDPQTKDEFHPSRLQMEDRTFVINWATEQLNSIKRGRSTDLESFRKQSPSDEVVDSRGVKVG